ncbi:HIRAN domain-containing protein [Acetitomaculum ruminis DSM 5522]|uniref:HIRAN domain-containing protein n=1 Tax=Acetitomaculum ruminis DSM 5522 TaxID=1120918 RepID=A0A1I0YD31_9FIRM|nr:HIRAN domain-containing protein [Acetitomaculum ruminis]SFB11234.1 HIRAN domain-containing protein [Acetitomaculum ruminis DSM 5522]
MANELTKKEETMVSLVKGNELGNIIKPLIKEIHLFDSYIAGTTHLDDKTVLEQIKTGDTLALQRENNKLDNNAILILNDEKKKLGYVPEKDNNIFARLMDAGKLLKTKITKIVHKGSFKQISVGIYLVDF